jgi:hypothetical protein
MESLEESTASEGFLFLGPLFFCINIIPRVCYSSLYFGLLFKTGGILVKTPNVIAKEPARQRCVTFASPLHHLCITFACFLLAQL